MDDLKIYTNTINYLLNSFKYSKRFTYNAEYGKDFDKISKQAIDDFVLVLRSRGWLVDVIYDKYVDNLAHLGIEVSHYVNFEIYSPSKL